MKVRTYFILYSGLLSVIVVIVPKRGLDSFQQMASLEEVGFPASFQYPQCPAEQRGVCKRWHFLRARTENKLAVTVR